MGLLKKIKSQEDPVEIKTAYESNADTNAFTDAQKTKLANQTGINTGDETTASIQNKRQLKTVKNQSLEGAGNIDLTKADVGLANADNTSDADKPVSTAQQTALDGKLAKDSNLSDVDNRQEALDNITNVASAANEQVLVKDTATGNAKFKTLPGISSGAYASVASTGVLTSSTTLAPLSGSNITNTANQFTIGTSSITCNKTGNYAVTLSVVVEPQATSSVAVTVFVNSTNIGETRYDSTQTGTGFFTTTSLTTAKIINNNDVITVSKANSTDKWKAIFISIVEII
jgi:hypothetical protein